MSDLVQEIGARLILKGQREFIAASQEVKKEITSVARVTDEANVKIIASTRLAAEVQAESAALATEAAALRQKAAEATVRALLAEAAGEMEVAKAAKAEATQLTLAARAARVQAGAAAESAAALRAQARSIAATAATAETSVLKSTGRMASAFTGLAKLGKVTVLGGAIVGVASIKMAGDFQQATSVLLTAAGESVQGLAVVRSGIKGIAVETGTSYKELEAGAYLLAKANYHSADAITVLRAAAQGAREENASLASVTNAMTSVMASYHLGPEKAVQVMNALKTGAGEAKTTMEDFATSLSTVIPIASQVGVSVAEVFGSLGTLTQHGTTAQEATQQLSSTIGGFLKMNRPQMTELSQLGLNPQDVQTNLAKTGPTGGLNGTIGMITSAITSHMGEGGKVVMSAFNQSQSAAQDLGIMQAGMSPELQRLAAAHHDGKLTGAEYRKTIKGLPTTEGSLLQQYAVLDNKSQGFNSFLRSGDPAAQTYTGALYRAMGTKIGLDTALQLSGPENASATQKRIGAVQSSITNPAPIPEGWEATQKLFNVAVDRGKRAIQGLMISIGDKLIPVVLQLGHVLMDGVRFLERHSTTAKVLAGIVGGVLVLAIMAYTVAMGAAAVATIVAAAPVLLIIAALALLGVGLVLLWNHSKAFRDGVIGIFQAVGGAVLTMVRLALQVLGVFASASDALFHTHFKKAIDGALAGIDVLQNKLDHIKDPKPVVVKVVAQLDPTLHAVGFVGPTQAESLHAAGILGPFTPEQTGASVVAGRRAMGGAVQFGRRYLIGENGPEEFTAPASGSIIRHSMIGAGGGVGAYEPGSSGNTGAAGGLGGSHITVMAGAIVIHESNDPRKTYEATKKGLADAVARS